MRMSYPKEGGYQPYKENISIASPSVLSNNILRGECHPESPEYQLDMFKSLPNSSFASKDGQTDDDETFRLRPQNVNNSVQSPSIINPCTEPTSENPSLSETFKNSKGGRGSGQRRSRGERSKGGAKSSCKLQILQDSVQKRPALNDISNSKPSKQKDLSDRKAQQKRVKYDGTVKKENTRKGGSSTKKKSVNQIKSAIEILQI